MPKNSQRAKWNTANANLASKPFLPDVIFPKPIETFERGKKYVVIKAWSMEVDSTMKIDHFRYDLKPGEILRFRGPNFTGAEFLDEKGRLVILPPQTAFKVMGMMKGK